MIDPMSSEEARASNASHEFRVPQRNGSQDRAWQLLAEDAACQSRAPRRLLIEDTAWHGQAPKRLLAEGRHEAAPPAATCLAEERSDEAGVGEESLHCPDQRGGKDSSGGEARSAFM